MTLVNDTDRRGQSPSNDAATAVVEGVGDHACEYMTGGRVAILGPHGRNLAAGMSGGVAYVLDLAEERVNREMVDIEPLTADDLEWLHDTVERHYTETGSQVAAALLADWGRRSAAFRRIMPKDYKRVLAALAEAERSGRDADEMVMEAARG